MALFKKFSAAVFGDCASRFIPKCHFLHLCDTRFTPVSSWLQNRLFELVDVHNPVLCQACESPLVPSFSEAESERCGLAFVSELHISVLRGSRNNMF